MAVGVSEAAKRLGVSPQRVIQLIAECRLPAQRVGRFWSIDEADIARHRVAHSRPLSQAMARGFLDLSAGVRPELSSRDTSRLRAKMTRLARAVSCDGDPARLLRSWLARRAVRRELSVPEADLPEVVIDDRLVLSGVSDARAAMSSPWIGEGYMSERNVEQFVRDYFIVEPNERVSANLILHVAKAVPPVSAVAVAADLADYRGGREDRQVQVVLENWIESGDYDDHFVFGRGRT